MIILVFLVIIKKYFRDSVTLKQSCSCFSDGVPVDCSWGVLENYSKLGPDYVKKTNDLRAKYHPIELDLSISLGRFEWSLLN